MFTVNGILTAIGFLASAAKQPCQMLRDYLKLAGFPNPNDGC